MNDNESPTHRSFLAPFGVLLIAMLVGGWFLQNGVAHEDNVYVQARLFQQVVDFVTNEYVDEVDPELIYNSAIDGIIQELGDPNSSFMEADESEDFWIRTDGEYSGVGLQIVQRPEGVTVDGAIPGGPAGRMGIRAGDIIAEVDGVSVVDWTSDQVVDLLRGEAGLAVEIKVLRPGIETLLPFEITRARIQLHSVPFATLVEPGIGYVPVTSVNQRAAEELIAAVDSLRGEGMQSMILDLRGNPGGYVDQAVNITDLFLEPGQGILEIRGRDPNDIERLNARLGQVYPDLSLVVLVDRGSASASEIIAGALQDHDRAAVLGEITFGKGSVQKIYPLSGGSTLRLTTGRWYTPLGRSIQRSDSTGNSIATGAGIALDGAVVLEYADEDRPEFTTPSGRTVLGGGGIVPDRFVRPDVLAPAEEAAVRRLLQSAPSLSLAIFDQAVRYLQTADVRAGFELPDTVYDELFRDLSERGSGVRREDFDGALRFIGSRLEQEVALQSLGELGAFERRARDDTLVQEALGLLRDVDAPSEVVSRAAELNDDAESSGVPTPR